MRILKSVVFTVVFNEDTEVRSFHSCVYFSEDTEVRSFHNSAICEDLK